MCTMLEITLQFEDNKMFNNLITYKEREWNIFLDKHIAEAEKIKNLVVLEMTVLSKGGMSMLFTKTYYAISKNNQNLWLPIET